MAADTYGPGAVIIKLGEKEAALGPGYMFLVFVYLFAKHKERIEQLQSGPALDVLLPFLESVGEHVLESSHAIETINELQGRIENRMQLIISPKSLYYWLHVNRHLPPEPFHRRDMIPVSASLWKRTTESAFAKFGCDFVPNEFVHLAKRSRIGDIASGNYAKAVEWLVPRRVRNKEGVLGTYLRNFSDDDLVAWFQIGYLADLVRRCVASKRRLYKGGTLVINPNHASFTVENDPDTDWLIDSFDYRHRYSGLASRSGVVITPPTEKLRAPMLVGGWNVHKYPLDQEIVKSLLGSEAEVVGTTIIPYLIWGTIDVAQYHDYHSFCSEQYFKQYGVSLETTLKTLYALSVSAFAQNPLARWELFQRGYSRWLTSEDLVDGCLNTLQSLPPDFGEATIPGRDDVSLVLRRFTLSEATKQSISLNTLGPRPMLISDRKGHYTVDLLAIPDVLSSMTSEFREQVQGKGPIFERYVKELVELTSSGILWKCSSRLTAADDSQIELDVSLVFKDILVICECKSISRSLAFEEGRSEALDFRKRKFEQAIQEVDIKANWLAIHPQGKNYALPPDVTSIIPVVVSPFVEYVWSRQSDLWLSEETPRICTPLEVAQINRVGLESARHRPFAKNITRP